MWFAIWRVGLRCGSCFARRCRQSRFSMHSANNKVPPAAAPQGRSPWECCSQCACLHAEAALVPTAVEATATAEADPPNRKPHMEATPLLRCPEVAVLDWSSPVAMNRMFNNCVFRRQTTVGSQRLRCVLQRGSFQQHTTSAR